MPLFGPPNVAKLATKGDVKGLIKALDYQKDNSVRTAAAEALGKIGDVRAVDPLIAALRDPKWTVSANAAEALGRIGDPRAVEPLIVAAKDIQLFASSSEALGKCGTRAVAPLIAALKDPESSVRGVAAIALGKIGDARAVDPLISALKDNHSRLAVSVALLNIGDPRAFEPLIVALAPELKDPALSRRLAAVTALGKTGDARAVDPLVSALEDENLAVRTAAADALGKIGGPRGEKGNSTPGEKTSRQTKPLKINLGDVQEVTLESIVENSTSMQIIQEMDSDLVKSDLVTPDLARRALEAKQHEQRADSLAQSREFKEAAEEYKKAIDIAPYEDEILFMSLGGVLSELREYTEALENLETASAINPLNEDVARNLGICRMNAGKT